MGFRDSKGDIIGDESNYFYKGKIGKNSRSSYKKTVSVSIILIILFLIASIFMYWRAFTVFKADMTESLSTAMSFSALAVYAVFRLKKYIKKEKLFGATLKKYDDESKVNDQNK